MDITYLKWKILRKIKTDIYIGLQSCTRMVSCILVHLLTGQIYISQSSCKKREKTNFHQNLSCLFLKHHKVTGHKQTLMAYPGTDTKHGSLKNWWESKM